MSMSNFDNLSNMTLVQCIYKCVRTCAVSIVSLFFSFSFLQKKFRFSHLAEASHATCSF